MTAQLSMFTGREILGRKQLKGKPIPPIGEPDLVLKVQDSRKPPALALDAPEPPPEPTREAVPLMPKCRPDWDPDKLDSEGYHALAARVRELDAERAKGNGWKPPGRRINKRALAHDRKRKAAQKEARQ